MKTKKNYSNKQKLQRLTVASVLAALSLVFMVVLRFPLFTEFYEMEFSDVPILVCSTLLGPGYAIATLFVVCLIQTLVFSSQSGIIGFIMHFLSSGLMIITLTFVQKKIGGLRGRIIAGLCGMIVMTLVMIPMNIWLTSSFMSLPLSEFISGFLGVCIAFNLVKSGSNILVFNIISPAIKKIYKKMFNIH